MYRYRSMTAYRSQSWMADGIGCRCGMGGILVTSLPFAEHQMLPFTLRTRTLEIRVACITCRRQGMVPVGEDRLPVVDPVMSEEILNAMTDYMWVEKKCQHQNFWCMSRALRGSWIDEEHTSPVARIHMAYCCKCRKRGPMQLPVDLSDCIEGKE